VPRATLFSPSGVQVSFFDANTQRSFTLTENGVYLVRVNANNLANTGSYNLGLECRQPLAAEDGTLMCGSLLSGSIGAAGEVDLITFNGQSGQVIDLVLVLTGGFNPTFGIVPRATLFSPTGTQVSFFDANSQRSFTLTENGVYLIRVNANDLVNTG